MRWYATRASCRENTNGLLRQYLPKGLDISGYSQASLDAIANLKHMELVQLLKTEHGLGHGHANALVAYHLA